MFNKLSKEKTAINDLPAKIKLQERKPMPYKRNNLSKSLCIRDVIDIIILPKLKNIVSQVNNIQLLVES